MAVKIVTDSSSDLPAQIAEELGIAIVPLYVRFGEEVYRERVDISENEFQAMLAGELTIGRLGKDWATVRLLEYGTYAEIIQTLGYHFVFAPGFGYISLLPIRIHLY